MPVEDRDQDQNCELRSCSHHGDEDSSASCTLEECVLSDFEYLVEVERSEAISHYEARLHDDRI